MVVLNFIRNLIGSLIFATGSLLVMFAYPILAASGRKYIKEGILKAVVERFTGTPATRPDDVVVARVEPRPREESK